MSSAADIDWSGPAYQPCPACDRGPKDRKLGVTVNRDGSGIARCFRCERMWHLRREDASTFRSGGKARRRDVTTPKRTTLSDAGMALFNDTKDVRGTIAEQYISARRGVVPPIDSDLRFHPALPHPTGYVGPALVALVTHAVTRESMTLHKTWICADGKKAAIEPPRMLLGGHAKKGGVIRLWPDEAVTYGLAVAEGVETALALANEYRPVWAAIDAGNLSALPVLPGIETLVIGADHDDAGIKAAETCADRWAAAGVDVRVIAPSTERHDWNDARGTG